MTDTRVSRALWPRSRALWLALALAGSAQASNTPMPACEATMDQVRLTVTVTGLRKAEGEMAITVYADDRRRFLAKGGKLLRQRVAAVAPATEACFVLPAPGFYAVSVYHDGNADRDFNRNLIGMPTEGFGFSRNPQTRLGLPALEEVRVQLRQGDNVLPIQLTYP